MCGIVGIVGSAEYPIERSWLESMNASIHHRGPDEDGVYVNGTVGLAMRRLSIIDVQGGRQPIHNEDKTVWCVFNGEIYNYAELRHDLEQRGHAFYTDSDTETLVHLYEEYGAQGITRLRGMFAYALWDEKRDRLILGRDRIGIKPLFYAITNRRLIFGSELKAFLAVPFFQPELNPAAIQQFLAYLYIPGPETIYQGVNELPPAHYLVYERGSVSLDRYWNIRYVGNDDVAAVEWEERFRAQFQESVKSHLISEVPLGAFLSGGIDSSAIVAAMAQASSKPVETFSIGHEGKGAFQDERQYARIVAERYGTRHHEFVVTTDVRDLLPKLAACFDQPFADSSAIPNFHICEMTKRHVTVALSGLGGDEVGGGYERYLGMLWAERYRKVPKSLRHYLMEQWIVRLSDVESGRLWLTRLKRFVSTADRDPAARYAALVTAFSDEERQRLLTGDFQRSGRGAPEQLIESVFSSGDADNLLHYLLLADLLSYLPGDLLTLTDRVSMYHSLEVRVPFLDHPLVELMAQVPAKHKIAGFTKKVLLKKAFSDLLPTSILHRKKLGFSVPLGLWLRTDLAGIMKEILSSEEIKAIGYLNCREVERIMAEHLSGQANHENKLWALINLISWHRSAKIYQ
jgi:asparagine synthase (glutamine-hydrolysing)